MLKQNSYDVFNYYIYLLTIVNVSESVLPFDFSYKNKMAMLTKNDWNFFVRFRKRVGTTRSGTNDYSPVKSGSQINDVCVP